MLVLIRGLPGAGKSTLAKVMLARGEVSAHFEADMFFEHKGRYQFDPCRLGDAHEWCYRQTAAALRRGASVAVSNTFTQRWEMKRYIVAAKALGVPVKVVRLAGTHGSIHNVPAASVERMARRFEDYSGEEIL